MKNKEIKHPGYDVIIAGAGPVDFFSPVNWR